MFRSLPAALICSAIITQIAIFTTTVWLHRTLSHRAVTVNAGVTWAFRVITWITTGLRPREWVAVHRLHHAHSDEEGDPHSPRLLSFNKVQFGNAYLYKRTTSKPQVIARYARDLQPDKWDERLFDHAIFGLGMGIAALCVLFGVWYGLIAAVMHAAAYLLMSGAINAIGHMWGKRPHANLATNCQWLALLVGGEGLHNNHHAVPTAAKFAFEPGQIDPGWYLVKLLERCGWATVRHKPALVKAKAAA
jgi:stearoyl-CoA desaturase (delta-9 desaturase)